MTVPGNYRRVSSSRYSPIFLKLTVGCVVGARTTRKVQEYTVTRTNCETHTHISRLINPHDLRIPSVSWWTSLISSAYPSSDTGHCLKWVSTFHVGFLVSFPRLLHSVTFIVAFCIQFPTSLTADAGKKIRRTKPNNLLALRTQTIDSSAEDHHDPNATFLFHTFHLCFVPTS